MQRYPNDRYLSRLQQLVESSYVLQGGIYIASNLPNSCRAWDCRVDVNAIGRWSFMASLRLILTLCTFLGWVMLNTCEV